MKSLLAAAMLTAIATTSSAGKAIVKDHYKTEIHREGYTVQVCGKKSKGQGAVEGAAIGALLGGALGNSDSAKALGIFGAIVGANESKNKTVCKNETRYTDVERVVYTHRVVTFTHEGRTYRLQFRK